jgi:hypothetical protein
MTLSYNDARYQSRGSSVNSLMDPSAKGRTGVVYGCNGHFGTGRYYHTSHNMIGKAMSKTSSPQIPVFRLFS